jgi:hypothetical protein
MSERLHSVGRLLEYYGRLHGPQRPSTLGWLLYITQRPVGRIASMPVTGHFRPISSIRFSRRNVLRSTALPHPPRALCTPTLRDLHRP